MQKKDFYFKLSILVFTICAIFVVTLGVSGAWYTDSKNASATISLGNAVSVTLDNSNVTQSSKIWPGERINVNNVTIKVPAESSTCFVRIKVEPTSNYYILDNSTTLTGESGYNWVLFDGYYYLTTSAVTSLTAIPEGESLTPMQASGSAKLNISNILVNPNLTQSNAGQSANITVTVHAIQAAHYAPENWADCYESGSGKWWDKSIEEIVTKTRAKLIDVRGHVAVIYKKKP